MREPDRRVDHVEWQKVVCHREPSQHDKRDRGLVLDCISKGSEAGAVDEARTDMLGGPHDRGVAVACRHPDYDVAWFDEGEMRCHRRAGHPIEHATSSVSREPPRWSSANSFSRSNETAGASSSSANRSSSAVSGKPCSSRVKM